MATDTIYRDHAPLFVLRACRKTGVIDALLSGTTDPAGISEETGITDRAAEIVLPTLAHLGYVERVDGEYRSTERLEVFDPETPVAERTILPHRLDILENYLQLPEIMRTGEYPEPARDELENYVGGMATIDESVVRAAVTETQHVHPRPDRVLDVGGSIGRFAREFAHRGSDVTLLDSPPVIDIVRPYLEDTDVELLAGDALDSLPAGFDVAFCGRLTVSFSPAENQQVFENLYDAVEPGGTVACMEFVRDRSATGPLFGAHMLAMSGTGNTHTAAQYREWLTDAGFIHPAVRDIPAIDFKLIVGHRPESATNG